MNPTLRAWLLGLGTAVVMAVVTATINYITGNPPNWGMAGLASGIGFAGGRMATVRTGG